MTLKTASVATLSDSSSEISPPDQAEPNSTNYPTSRAFSSERPIGDTEGRSTIDARRQLAVRGRRSRIRQRGLTFALTLLPVLLAAIYLVAIATPRYAAESRFSVQAAQSAGGGSASGSPSAMTSILSGGAGVEAGLVGGWLVQDFLNSRDCMRQLDRKIGLRRYLVRTSWDPVTRLAPQANEDALFRAYQRAVHSSFNMIEQVNVLTVYAYSPEDSRAIANGLLSVAQDFVNTMNQQGIDDAIRVSRRNVEQAERQDRDALRALGRWRSEHGNFDPAANASMILNQIGLVEADLSNAKLTVDKIDAFQNPDHPMAASARLQVQALERRKNELRGLMVDRGSTSAADLKTFGELTNAQTFADSNLMVARQTYQQAYTSALAVQRYLAIIAHPVPELRASEPNPPLVLLAALAAGCALAGAWSFAAAIYRSFRYA